LSFLPVASELVGFFQVLRVNLLNSDFAAEFNVTGAVYGGKTACTDLFQKLVSRLNIHELSSSPG